MIYQSYKTTQLQFDNEQVVLQHASGPRARRICCVMHDWLICRLIDQHVLFLVRWCSVAVCVHAVASTVHSHSVLCLAVGVSIFFSNLQGNVHSGLYFVDGFSMLMWRVFGLDFQHDI